MRKLVHPLRRWREENRVTLMALSEESGLSDGHLSLVERDLKGVSLTTAAKLSNITGIPIEDFVREPV